MSQQPGKILKITLLLASTLTMMAGAVISPALPAIKEVFAENPQSEILSKMLVTLPALFVAFFSPLAGYVIDKVGRKRLLLFSLILYAVSGMSGFFLHSLWWILAGRIVLGISIAGIMNTVITLVGDYFEGQERHRFMGLQGAFMGIGGVLYISLAGLLTSMHWQYPFLLYLLSVFIAIPAFVYLYEPDVKKEKPGQQARVIIPPAHQKLFRMINLVGFTGIVLFFLIPVQVPFLLDHAGINATLIGLSISLFSVAQSASSMLYRKIKSHCSFKEVFFIAFMLMGIGYVVLAFSETLLFYIGGLMLGGLGTGLFMPNGNLWVITLAPEQKRGRLIGHLSLFSFTGQFLSPILVQPLLGITSLPNVFLLSGLFLVGLSLLFLLNRKEEERI